MDELELRFTEGEVADVLWALYQAIELADQLNAFSTRAHLERVYGFVRDRFDQRRPGGQ